MNPRILRFRSAPIFAGVFAALWLAGCATQDTAPDTDTADASEEAPAIPRASFTNLEEGQTVATSYEVIFSVENFNIAPIEDPLVVRPGEGHYHVAVDVDCIAGGVIIPPGTPSYIHFGDGSDRITMQFETGEHRLCLQVADGEHRVIGGSEHSNLTQEVRFTVAEE